MTRRLQAQDPARGRGPGPVSEVAGGVKELYSLPPWQADLAVRAVAAAENGRRLVLLMPRQMKHQSVPF